IRFDNLFRCYFERLVEILWKRHGNPPELLNRNPVGCLRSRAISKRLSAVVQSSLIYYSGMMATLMVLIVVTGPDLFFSQYTFWFGDITVVRRAEGDVSVRDWIYRQIFTTNLRGLCQREPGGGLRRGTPGGGLVATTISQPDH